MVDSTLLIYMGIIIVLSMTDINLSQQRVLIREDLNVPLHQGKITNDERIQRALPTIKAAVAASAAVMVCSHLGRPNEGEYDVSYSLAPVAEALTQALGQPVKLVKDWLGGIDVQPGDVVLCENVRFNVGEKSNDPDLAKRMAALCDVFVMDAFATAHRAQASTVGVTEFAPVACAGPLLLSEITALHQALDAPAKPLLAIVGGSKVSTKIQLLERLIPKLDTLIVGGGIANTFLAAMGYTVGASLYEKDRLKDAVQLIELAAKHDVKLPLPVDVAVTERFDASSKRIIKSLDTINVKDMILDIGPDTAALYAQLLGEAGTIVWNGPVGVFEFPEFSEGTRSIGQAIAQSDAYSLAGGGDTVFAIDQFGLSDSITYISTGGGAFLAWMQGDVLPAIAALEQKETV